MPSSGSASPFLLRLRSTTPILPRNEVRALWVARGALSSRESIDRVVELAVRGRFHLLFAQVRGRGEAFYRSGIEPPAQELEEPIEAFDPLAYLLALAHEAGISVHAWINVFYVWSDRNNGPPPGHVARLHPEWLLRDVRGMRMDEIGIEGCRGMGAEGYFLSPADRGVRMYTVGVIREVVTRYAVDGVHLDYIRYPGPSFGFSRKERTRFALIYGVDPFELVRGRAGVAGVVGEGGLKSLDSLFVEWRSQQVDSMVLAIRAALSEVPLSAAVLPEPWRARELKGQDWIQWVQRGDVDFVVVMAYAYLPAELKKQVGLIKNEIGCEKFLVGLPLFDGRSRYLGYSVSMLRQKGVVGYSLFSYDELARNPFALKFLARVFWGEG